jgi:hypothetical protein
MEKNNDKQRIISDLRTKISSQNIPYNTNIVQN